MRSVHFHEDDYCQIEAIAMENFEWAVEEARKIDEFSAAHRAGLGWDAMYLRTEPPLGLKNRGITTEAFTTAVSPHLPQFHRVTTGYSTHVEEIRTAIAFGIDNDVAMFAEHRNGIVVSMWFALSLLDEERIETVLAALTALSEFDLALADWGWTRIIPMKDENALREYLRQRVVTFGERSK